MIEGANRLCAAGSVAVEAPSGPAAAPAFVAAPGTPPRAGRGGASRWRWLPALLGGRPWALLFALSKKVARARRGGDADGGTGYCKAAGAARAAAAFRAWRAEGPRTFDTLYGSDGSLRRDVVTVLWQRIEQLLPAPLDVPGPVAAGAAVARKMPATTPATTTTAEAMPPVPDDGAMTAPELHALAGKLKRAEDMLGTQDGVALRAVRTLREQVRGAQASLGRPLMVAAAARQAEACAQAGAASARHLGMDLSIPGLPLSATVSPRIGATYASGLEVGDDLGINEGRTFEARIGVVGRIKAFFLNLDLGLAGRHARSVGRNYRDRDHLLEAPDSRAYRAARHVAGLEDLADSMAHSRSRWGVPKAFSLQDLDRLRQAACADYDAFAKTAAMLGVVVTRPQAGGALHPLSENHRTAVGAGSPSRTVTTGVKLTAGAGFTADITSVAGGTEAAFESLHAHARAEAGGAKSRTAIRTYVPAWEAFGAQEAERAGEETTRQRLAHLRAAFLPMLRALQRSHAGPAWAEEIDPAVSRAMPNARRALDLPRILDAVTTWRPGEPPVSAVDLNSALDALALELDLYCLSMRGAPHDERAREPARAIEQAWGIAPGQGAYGYMRALAIAAALIGRHARETRQFPLAAYDALTARLAAPALRHDGALMKRATGFEDTLPIETWKIEMALGAGVGMSAPGRPKRESSLGDEVAQRQEGTPISAPGRPKEGPSIGLPPLGAAADIKGSIRGSRVAHFNALKAGDFIDVEVSVGLSARLGLGGAIEPIVEPIAAWAGGQLSDAMGAWAEAGLPAGMAGKLKASIGDALKAVSPSIGAGAHLVVAFNYSKPLATAPGPGDEDHAFRPGAGAAPGFNLEHVRVLARIDGAQNTETVPLTTIMGEHAIRSVLMRLDNCYRKDGDPARGEREARAYLASRPVRRDLPAMFVNLGKDDNAAIRQVRAFVRVALAQLVDADAHAGARRALRACEEDFFNAMRAYAAAAAVTPAPAPGHATDSIQEDSVQVPALATAGQSPTNSQSPTNNRAPSSGDAGIAHPRASSEYATAEQALLALATALTGPAGIYQGKRMEYATTLGRLRTGA
ncbi:hypothetical protein [Achromobacter aloeverae]